MELVWLSQKLSKNTKSDCQGRSQIWSFVLGLINCRLRCGIQYSGQNGRRLSQEKTQEKEFKFSIWLNCYEDKASKFEWISAAAKTEGICSKKEVITLVHFLLPKAKSKILSKTF